MYYKLWALCDTVAGQWWGSVYSRPDFRGQWQYIRKYRLDAQVCIKFGVVNPLFIWNQLSTRSLRQMLCGSQIRIWNLSNHMKKQSKKHLNARFIDEKWKTKSLMFVVLFFMWFARFQILRCEPQRICCKLLVLSWLYKMVEYTKY